MDIKTKYNLNQKVWGISHQHEQKFVPCKSCDAIGRIILADGETINCPKCYGRKGITKHLPIKWLVSRQLTIGEVYYKVRNIESDGVFDNIGEYKEGNNVIEEGYMAYETGIGSGTRHYVNRLYPTKKEAQAECDKRNKENSEQHN